MREWNPKETKGLHKGHASDKTEVKRWLIYALRKKMMIRPLTSVF